MKILRWTPLLLALGAAGCILVSGQFLVSYDLGRVDVTSPTNVVGVQVDLSDDEDYVDNKDKIQGLSEEALLGYVKNNRTEPVQVVAWMTPDLTTYTDEADVRANGVEVWGPLDLGPEEQVRVSWDQSVGLLTPGGKQLIEQEVRGDGIFTVYVIGKTGNYDLTVTSGKFVVIVDAGD